MVAAAIEAVNACGPLPASAGWGAWLLTYKDVAEILKIIDASELEEVVIELEGLRLVVRRGNPHGGPSQSSAAPGPQAAKPRLPRAHWADSRRGDTSRGTDVAVRAPMVGSFYRRPSPDAPPFVEVGTRVRRRSLVPDRGDEALHDDQRTGRRRDRSDRGRGRLARRVRPAAVRDKAGLGTRRELTCQARRDSQTRSRS